MPKFQSEMQFASYLPVCSTTKDHPASDSSKTWLQNNNDQINGDGCSIPYSPGDTSQLQDHEKEILKKTMLQHEATFKHQLTELHRVYGRQNELMNEIKTKYLSANNVEGTTSNSNSIMFEGLSASSDQTFYNPNFALVDPSCQPSSIFDFRVAPNINAGKSMQADTVSLPCSSKEFCKRTFDLELSADDYIDCEEEKFGEETVSGVSKAPDYAVKDLPAVYNQKDLKLPIRKDQLNPSEGNSSGANLIPSITNLADLNEMFQLKKEGTQYSTTPLPLDTRNMEKLHLEQSYFQMPKTVFQVQTKEIDCFQIGKDLENRSGDLYPEKVSRQHEHASSNHLISATKPFDAPASGSSNATLSIRNYTLNKNVHMSSNLTYDPRSANVCSLQNNLLHRLPAADVDSSSMFSSQLANLTNSLKMVHTHGNEKLDSTIQGVNWHEEKLVPGGISDKLNESLSQGLGLRPPKEFLMSSSYIEPKWHGTSAILNYESIYRSSNNSQLTNNQLFKSYPNLSEVKVANNYEEIGILDRRPTYALTVSKMNWSAQSEMLKNGVDRKFQIDLNSLPNEDGSAQMEVETKGASDINLKPPVSPENKESSPPRGNSMEKQPTDSVKSTEQECQEDLAVFAAEALLLISSNSARCLEWFAGVVSSAANDQEEESETLQGRLAGSDHIELVADGLNNSAATLSSLPKRRRTQRSKSQKAMQGDILPHLTSPSRQEVSLDTTISRLRENEGKARFGKKKLSKHERQKGKKHNSKSNVSQHPMCSYPEQQTDDALLDSLKRCLPSWGRRNNRQTGRRRPALNRAF